MHVDLITLYLLAIGTLLASCAMTLWERRMHPKRSKELTILAAGYATLAAGCAAASFRFSVPGVIGSAVSNIVIVSGYLCILLGVAHLNGRQYRGCAAAILVLLALTWAVVGTRWPEAMWIHVSAIPIALACGLTARELLFGSGVPSGQSRSIAVIVSGAHALFYAARACLLPWLVSALGPGVQSLTSKITMYEGVLYSVILPMTLLRLFRDESHGQLLRESTTDYLTGLGNRRQFFQEGTQALRHCDAARPASVFAFDLDHFKRINDRHGHDAGDEVLRSFAQTARSVLGPEAILARIGGEEFAAVLPGYEGIHAKAIGEAVIRRFGQTISRTMAGVEIKATVSAGMAHCERPGLTLAESLATADRALYSAKSQGGNRLEFAEASIATAQSPEHVSRERTSV